jgi:hypothetical protein
MLTMTIRNPEADANLAMLVNVVFQSMQPHWLAILPTIEIVIADKQFDQIDELKEFCRAQSRQPYWSKSLWRTLSVICPEYDSDSATIWVRAADTCMHPPEYYFKKALYALLANMMWHLSEELRGAASQEAPWLDSGGALYLAFRDSFSRFYLNPEWLENRRPAAWLFMTNLDRRVKRFKFQVV